MNRIVAIGAVALALLAGGAWWLSSNQSATHDLPGGAVSAQEGGDASEIDTSSIEEMTLGADDAPVTIIEYASFTCPHCANFHKGPFKQLKADYVDTGKVQFVYRDVYFDRLGLWAALVARCGGEERFFGITDMLYEQQRDWIGSGDDPVAIANNLRRIGKVAGLGDDQVEACLQDSDKAKTLVAWYQQNAEEHGVNSTPTLIIDGQKHSNMSYADLRDIIESRLAE